MRGVVVIFLFFQVPENSFECTHCWQQGLRGVSASWRKRGNTRGLGLAALCDVGQSMWRSASFNAPDENTSLLLPPRRPPVWLPLSFLLGDPVDHACVNSHPTYIPADQTLEMSCISSQTTFSTSSVLSHHEITNYKSWSCPSAEPSPVTTSDPKSA